MEQRFSFRDLILVMLLVALIISVWLAMKQYDRQWDVVQSIDRQLSQQTRDLSAIRRAVERGGPAVLGPAQTQAGPAAAELQNPEEPDAFSRLREARKHPGFATGDWCVDAFGANVAKITPLVVTDVYGSRIGSFVLETLAVRDPATLDWLPLVAKSWQISQDGLTITFDLREHVTFSDGHPLTAEDIEFTFQMILNPKIDAPRVRDYYSTNIASVTADGPYRVVFKFKEPYFESFGLAAGMEILPKHFYSQFSPDDINRRPGLLMGSGPYRMDSPTDWAPGKLLALVRNERYWGVAPAFDRLVYHEINNDVSRLTMFRNGEIDVFAAQPEQYVKLVQDKALMEKVHRFEFEAITGGYGFIAWNQSRNGKATPFADKRVRQAMTMMIPTQRLFDEILLGFGIPVTGPFNRLSKQSDPSVKPWPYDVSRARQLLAEAGYRDVNRDGIIDSPNGQPLRFSVTFPSGTNFWDRVLLLLKDSLAEAGVVMDLEPLEWAVFDERLKARDFDALTMAWSGGIESDIRQMFHSTQIKEGDNFTSYSNPELDELIDQARRTVVEEKRMPLWQAAHRILHEDQPYTFLYSRRATILMDKRIANIQQVKTGLNDRTEWFVPQPMQKWTK